MSDSSSESTDEDRTETMTSEESSTTEESSSSEEEIVKPKGKVGGVDMNTIDPLTISDFDGLQDIANEEAKKLEGKKMDKYGKFRIWRTQQLIANVFMKSEGITALMAKQGFGKTLTAYAIGKQSMRCLIVVPTGTLLSSTWIAKGQEYGLIDPDVNETTFFIYDTKYMPNHRELLTSSNVAKRFKDKRLVIVCKNGSLSAKKNRDGKIIPGAIEIFKNVGLNGNEFTVVVDEAHSPNIQLLNYLQPLFNKDTSANKTGIVVTRELLMSGSEIDMKENRFEMYSNKVAKGGKVTLPRTAKTLPITVPISGGKYEINHTIEVFETDPVPRDDWKFVEMSSASFSSDPSAWKKQIKKILQKHSNVAICAYDKDFDEIAKGIKDMERTVTIATGAKKNVIDFNNGKYSAILFSQRQSRGLNLHADALIIVNPSDMQSKAIHQTSRRIIRSDSRFDDVTIYVLYGDIDSYLKAYYVYSQSCIGWRFGMDHEVNTAMVYKCVGVIRAVGSSTIEIGRIDACILLANYLELVKSGRIEVGEVSKEIITWWEEQTKKQGQKTILNERIIQDIAFG